MNAELRGLMHHVIHERRNADQHVRLKSPEEPYIALGAHHLAAARAEHHDARSRARVMRQPERQMRREG